MKTVLKILLTLSHYWDQKTKKNCSLIILDGYSGVAFNVEKFDQLTEKDVIRKEFRKRRRK